MATTITWEQLRGLASFRTEAGRAVSLYMNLDPSVVPTPADAQTRMRPLLAEAERLLEEGRQALSHEERAALRADLGRLERWFAEEFDRQGAHGLAVFAAGLDNLWTTLPLGEPVDDRVTVDTQLYLAPLARLVGRGDGALVASVGRERGQVFRLRAGQLVEVADQTAAVPGQHDQGGWAQARYERHIETIVDRHLRDVADTLDGTVRKLRGSRVVLVGSEEVRSGFEGLLSREVQSRLVGWATAEAHADASELLDAAQPLLDRWEADRNESLLERWREEASRNGRAATGWHQTLEAASDGRVELLLVQDGVDQPAFRCPACGRTQLTNGSCPLDGTTMESRDGGLDLALHQTLEHGGTVQVIRDRRDLDPVGGVAALLRF